MGGAVGAIAGVVGKIMPIFNAVSKFVPALQSVSSAFSAFGQVANAFQSLTGKTQQANAKADEQKDKTKDVFNTIGGAANTVTAFAKGDIGGAAKGIAGLFA